MLSIADYLSLSSAEQDRVFPQLSREKQLPAAELESSFEVLGCAVEAYPLGRGAQGPGVLQLTD